MSQCPKCQAEIGHSAPECPQCGVIIAKVLARQQAERAAQQTQQTALPQPADQAKAPLPRPEAPLRLRRTQQALFFRQLGHLLQSGIAVVAALRSLEGTHQGTPAALARRLREQVEAGDRLASAFASCGTLSQLALTRLEALEHSGALPAFFTSLADQLDIAIRLRRDFLVSLAYPALLVVISILMLPLPTAILQSFGAYALIVAKELAVLAAVALLFGVGLPWLVRRLDSRGWWHTVLWHVPIAGRMYQLDVLGGLAAELGEGIDAGLSPQQILHHGAQLSKARPFGEAMTRATAMVKQGEPLTLALGDPLLAFSEHRALLSTGEQSGALVDSFRRIAADVADRLARRIRLVSRVGSVLVLLLALIAITLQIVGAYQQRMDAFHKGMETILHDSGVKQKPATLKDAMKQLEHQLNGLDQHPAIKRELRGVIKYEGTR